MDPIEKKPLFHFYPGKPILSLGFYGCNFRCPFCQNHEISQHTPVVQKKLSPLEAVNLALDQGSFGIAYTYSEPGVHHEWIIETAQLASQQGLKNVLISNGYLNQEPAKELIEVMDGANIDLKSFSNTFYNELGGSLDPVLQFIAESYDKLHLEVTTLIIPGKNDSLDEMESMTTFLSNLSSSLPYHLSAYYPHFKYTAPPTDPDHLLTLAKVAKKKLDYVYTGNIITGDNNTYCPKCGALLIKRNHYNTKLSGITDKSCNNCKNPTNFIIN